MSKYLLAAVAAAAIATPAVAHDGSPYVGVDGGLMYVQSHSDNYQGVTGSQDGSIRIKHKTGYDLDAVAGYDFGMFRAEVEAGYKHAGIKGTNPNIPNFGPFFGDGGKGRTVSLMGNVMADFGPDDGLSGFVGGGVGVARTSLRVGSIHFGGPGSTR